MMRRTILLAISLISCEIFSQSINLELKEKLDSIMILDQSMRELLDSRTSGLIYACLLSFRPTILQLLFCNNEIMEQSYFFQINKKLVRK